MEDRAGSAVVVFSHPLARAAIYDALPKARRSALNTAAAAIVHDTVAAMRHRVEAATITNHALLADLEAHAHDEVSRGALVECRDEPDRREPVDSGPGRS